MTPGRARRHQEEPAGARNNRGEPGQVSNPYRKNGVAPADPRGPGKGLSGSMTTRTRRPVRKGDREGSREIPEPHECRLEGDRDWRERRD